MKVAFVNPRGNARDPQQWLPLGPASVATLLAKQFEVKFIDGELRPQKLQVLKGYDVVCVGGMSHQADGIRLWAKTGLALRKRVVVGGIHATLTDEYIEGTYHLKGLGERWVERLCLDPELEPGVYDDTDMTGFEPDFYSTPMRSAFGWRQYKERVAGLPAIRVVGARGCPFRCRYCCNRKLVSGKVVHRGPVFIEREIEEAKDSLGVQAVVFAMPNFTASKSWAREMSGRLGKLQVAWKATTRVELVDSKTLRAMKNGGCIGLGFGVESGDDGVLEVLGKGSTVEQAMRAFRLCKEERLPTWAMFMTHVPGETPETLKRTRAFARELEPDLGTTFQRFSPLPGSEFFDELEKWGEVTERNIGGFGPVGFVPRAFAEARCGS